MGLLCKYRTIGPSSSLIGQVLITTTYFVDHCFVAWGLGVSSWSLQLSVLGAWDAGAWGCRWCGGWAWAAWSGKWSRLGRGVSAWGYYVDVLLFESLVLSNTTIFIILCLCYSTHTHDILYIYIDHRWINWAFEKNGHQKNIRKNFEKECLCSPCRGCKILYEPITSLIDWPFCPSRPMNVFAGNLVCGTANECIKCLRIWSGTAPCLDRHVAVDHVASPFVATTEFHPWIC